jgi:hypothetical protein
MGYSVTFTQVFVFRPQCDKFVQTISSNSNYSLFLSEKAVDRKTNVSHDRYCGKLTLFRNLPKSSMASTFSNGKRGPSEHFNDAGQTNPCFQSLAHTTYQREHRCLSLRLASASAPIPRI